MDFKEQEFLKSHGYRILHTIGQGTYGVIFSVYSEKFKQQYAIKRVQKNCFYQNELDCLMSIDEPNIVRLYQKLHYNGYEYLVMELCQTDLEKYISNKYSITDDEIRDLCRNVVLSIKACHDRDIAHCDIKPGNFLVDFYNRVKVSDFGLSMKMDGVSTSNHYTGTKVCMAPELIEKKVHDPMASDVWAVGCTLYYIATGRYPFFSRSQQELDYLIIHSLYNASLVANPLLREVITKCLKIDPEERYTISEIIKHPYFANEKELPRISKRNCKSKSNLSSLILSPIYSIRKSTHNLQSQIICAKTRMRLVKSISPLL